MIGSRSGQLAGACGFAVLLVGGLVLQGLAGAGVEEETRREVQARYADEGNELLALAGGFLLGIAILFLFVFLGTLRAALRQVEERAVLSTVALAGGILLAVMLLVSSATTVAAFSSYDFYDAYEIDPASVLLLQSLAFSALGSAFVGAAALVGATSLVALKTALLPRWLALAGLALALICSLGELALYVPLPVPLLALWVLAVSVVLTRVRAPLAGPRAEA